MNNTALIFGAGKTGRGFAAHLAFLGGYHIILIDKDKQLVNDLNKARKYEIQILDKEEKSITIDVFRAYHVDDVAWHEAFLKTSLAFTAVFGNNLEDLAEDLALALDKRYTVNPTAFLTIITCENLVGAAGFLKKAIQKNLAQEKEKWLSAYIGFSESIIFRTCLNATADQSPLAIRSQNFFELPCDGDAIKGDLHVYGLKPLKNFNNQLKRKIYTYNCINAVITYLGAKKGYDQLYEAGNDAEIISIARQAGEESSRALVAEFGFDSQEQEAWTNAAFIKFADKNIPDPIERNGADPARKLSREDRLIGPALLALQHGIYPEGLLEGIIACFDYKDQINHFSVAGLIKEKGLDRVLKEVCGLSEKEELFMLIKERSIKRSMDGK